MQAFNSNTPERLQQRKSMHELCRQFDRSPSHGNLKRLKNSFSHCGDDVFIEGGFYCDYGHAIHLGNRVYINTKCTFLDAGTIYIGDDSLIGPNVQILAVNHDIMPIKRLEKLSYALDTHIGKNVWIGAGAIILPGISIGDNSVIGAGSIVSKDIPESSFAAGNPATIKKKLDHN